MLQKHQVALSTELDMSTLVSMFRHVATYRTYWHKWITIDAWLEIIRQKYNLDEYLEITPTRPSLALSRSPALRGSDQLKSPSVHGIYQSKRQIKVAGKNKRIVAYYVTLPSTLPKEMPGGNTKWHDAIVSTNPNPGGGGGGPLTLVW